MITDPVIIRWHKKYQCYYLTRGNETFFDDDRYLLTWGSAEEATKWCSENLFCEVDSGALDPNTGTGIDIKQPVLPLFEE